MPKELRPAYERYLKTGDVTDIWGRTRRGKGPPEQPVTQEQFYSMIQKAPEPTAEEKVNIPFTPEWEADQSIRKSKASHARWLAKQDAMEITRRMTGERE